MIKKLLIFASIVVLGSVGIVGYVWYERIERVTIDLPPARSHVEEDREVKKQDTKEPVQPHEEALPDEVNLAIPFTSQAPHKNWDLPYKEFCEEASALMAASYIHGENILDADDADKKLLALQAFVVGELKFAQDTNAEETAEMLRKFYKIKNVAVVENPTIDGMKQALAQGKAIIVPAAGRQLGNPYYRSPGPLYHMLVVKGYTKDGKFITNDPGTRRGADYLYDADVLMRAMHDWNNGNVDEGRKVIIIVG